MADLGNFDANDVAPSEDFSPIPADTYRVMITDSEVKRNSKDTGSFLSLKVQLTGNEQYDGRILFVNLNLDNPNEDAVKIAERDLSAICHAVKVMKPGNSEKLHDIPFLVKVGVEKRKDNGELTNRIKAYLKLEDKPEENAAKGKADWMGK